MNYGAKQTEVMENMRQRKDITKIISENDPSDTPGYVEVSSFKDVTDSPLLHSRMANESNNDCDELEDFNDEEESIEESEEEKVEEMTQEEKKDMYEAVKKGDIDLLEDCLDRQNSDINMTWFKENLLMTAIRWKHQEMAEFLLDNGVDSTQTTSVLGLKETSKGKTLERYELSCRQMAYDNEMHDLVELIDSLQGKLFLFIRPPARTPRLRRLMPPNPSMIGESFSCHTDSSNRSDVSSSGSESDNEGSEVDTRSTYRRKKKTKKGKHGENKVGDNNTNNEEINGFDGKDSMIKRDKIKRHRKDKQKDCHHVGVYGNEDAGEEKDKTMGTLSGLDIDSGHHSMGSNKLVKSLLKQHDMLSEREATTLSALATPRTKHDSEATTEKNESVSVSTEKPGMDRNDMNDEGYGSVSCKNLTHSASPKLTTSWAIEPKNRIRTTKSALSIRKANNNYRHNNCLRATADTVNRHDKPLQWRKVSSLGSYASECRKWHAVVNTKENFPELSEHLSETNKSSNMNPASTMFLPKAILRSDRSSPALSLESERFQMPSKERKSTLCKHRKDFARCARPRKGTMTITKTKLSPQFSRSYGDLDFHISEIINLPVSRFKSGASSDLSSISSMSSVSLSRSAATVKQKRHGNYLFRS